MRAAGFPVYGYKLAAFVIAGALAGLAGFLVAARDGVVNPELLAWHNSGEVLLMIILGGLGHLRGAVIGAVAFTLLKELLSTHAIVGAAGRPLAADAGPGHHRLRRAAAQGHRRHPAAAGAEGGGGMSTLLASRDTDAPLRRPGRGQRGEPGPAPRRGACGDRHQRRRQVDADQHALGRDRRRPTAASRSTAPTSRRRAQFRRALAGVGRSYQRTTIFPEFTVLENCRLAAQAALAAAVGDLAVVAAAARTSNARRTRSAGGRRPGRRGRAASPAR